MSGDKIPIRKPSSKNGPVPGPTFPVSMHPYRTVGARRGPIARLVDSWRDIKSARDASYTKRYQWLQVHVAPLLFAITAIAAIGMVGVFVVAIWNLGTSVYHGIGALDSHKTMTEGLQALELFILAPLPYLLMLGLGRYVDTLAHSKDAKAAKMELLDFKAFEVALFIAIIAAYLIGQLFSNLDTNSHATHAEAPATNLAAAPHFDYAILGWCSLVLVALVGYFWILEHLGEMHEHEFKDHPRDFYRMLAVAEDAKVEEDWESAAIAFRDASHHALSHKGEDDKRPWRAQANYALCVQLWAVESEKQHQFIVGCHIMHEACGELLRQGDGAYVDSIWEQAEDYLYLLLRNEGLVHEIASKISSNSTATPTPVTIEDVQRVLSSKVKKKDIESSNFELIQHLKDQNGMLHARNALGIPTVPVGAPQKAGRLLTSPYEPHA